MAKELNGAEAVYGFMGWLTTREKTAGPFSGAHNAGEAAVLCNEFCETNGLAVSNDWPKFLKHPGWDYKYAGPDK